MSTASFGHAYQLLDATTFPQRDTATVKLTSYCIPESVILVAACIGRTKIDLAIAFGMNAADQCLIDRGMLPLCYSQGLEVIEKAVTCL